MSKWSTFCRRFSTFSREKLRFNTMQEGRKQRIRQTKLSHAEEKQSESISGNVEQEEDRAAREGGTEKGRSKTGKAKSKSRACVTSASQCQ